MVSVSFGLVGVSKLLIDRIGNAIASMHFHQWMIIIRKERARTSRDSASQAGAYGPPQAARFR